MSTPWNAFKLGLLTIAVVAALAVVTLALAIRVTPKETVQVRSYFDESVVGLEVGAPVKYRGITIGSVKSIGVAPDNRLVEVTSDVRKEHLAQIDWRREHDDGLRVRVSAPGLTGVKLLDLEYVDPARHPPVALPFAAPEHYVPSAPSLLSGLEHIIETVTDSVVAALARVEQLVTEIDRDQVPQQTIAALASVTQAASELRAVVHQVSDERLAGRAAASLGAIDSALASIDRVTKRIDADGGLIDRAEDATERVETFGDRANGVTGELDRTVRDLGDAARSVRGLADAIERDPDMLIKGKAKNGAKAKGGSR